MKKEFTFRTKTNTLLSDDITQWIVIIALIALTIWVNTVAYFLGVGFVLIVLWARKWDFRYFGLVKPIGWLNVLLQAFLYSLVLFLVVDLILTPVSEYYTKETIDISSLDGIRGNWINYLIFILFMWVVAGFGEEFLYRGLLIERLGKLFGSTKVSIWIAALISSILFGLAHRYQGISGMLTTGAGGFLLGIIFIKNKNRLWVTILTHGIYDMIGITLIYFDIENDVYNALKNLLI